MGRPGIVTPHPMALPEHEICARLFRALSDGTRVRIIDLLTHRGSVSQQGIVEILDIRQSRASEHLGVLIWAGFVEATRQGRSVSYRLVNECAPALLREMRDFYRRTDGAAGGCTLSGSSLMERYG